MLGTARRVVVTKETTTIVDGGGADRRGQGAGSTQIRKEIEASDSDWDKEKLNERLAKLSGGIAVIKVGAATEVEMKERKHRIEDAISATKAAVEEGIVPGGGAALAQIASVLDDGLGLTGDESDRRLDRAQGARRAAALDRPERRPRRLRRRAARSRELEWGNGLNAATGEYVDLAKAGIVDPVKVTRNAVANAASIAGLLLTTESLIVEKPKAPEPAAGGGHGHGHGHQHGPGF